MSRSTSRLSSPDPTRNSVSGCSRPGRVRVGRARKALSALREVERLEDRVTPVVLDLSVAPGLSGAINGAVFTGSTHHNTSGSGAIDSFVRVSSKETVEQGYNTDARPIQSGMDTDTTSTFVHSLKLSDLAAQNVVVKGGVSYYEFVLDINQKDANPAEALLSLDELRFYVSPSPALNNYDAGTGKLNGLSPVYDMDGGLDPSDFTYVKLNYDFNTGGGS